MTRVLASRTFDEALQHRFAELSGDRNPMHVDPVYARRTQAGVPAVHGMHLTLWALDTLAAQGLAGSGALGVDVNFLKFVAIGDRAELRVMRENETVIKYAIAVRDLVVATLSIRRTAPPRPEPLERSAPARPLPPAPAAFSLGELGERRGVLQAPERSADLAKVFPGAAQRFGSGTVAALGQLSALVGMVVPGLHSIFDLASLRLDDAQTAGGLAYAITKVDDRYRLATIAVDGAGVAGIVSAFVRQPPVEPPSRARIAAVVAPAEFAATTALIVGGSRGLGAVTARVLASGGARVVATYVVGEREANALCAEVGSDRARALRYDVRGDAAEQLRGLPWDVDHVYYFATAPIFRASPALFSAGRFAEFSAYYVDGFAALCAELRARGRPVRVFYPSSIAVAERPREMTEYAMAKAAGEVFCADLDRFERDISVVMRRLPRLLTDQTATVMRVPAADPLELLVAIVREMHAHP